VRCVSDWGAGRTVSPQKRPLKLLFMACSPLDSQPVLEFEKEEEAIFQATTGLAVEMDVEDTGSLEGLQAQLLKGSYDVVHLSGHASLDAHGQAYFVMEDETGAAKPVFPGGLWHDALQENRESLRLVFLSGCRTGETTGSSAEVSFAQELVSKHRVESVLGWGRSVSDEQASLAARYIYLELSQGRDLLTAVQRARYEMDVKYGQIPQWDWPLLRVFSGEAVMSPLVEKGQLVKPKPRDLAHTYLENSEIKVLKRGFVGRRRPLQHGLRALKTDNSKCGILIQGAGGLGKSCLAGKICERFPKHRLMVVHGRFNAVTLQEAMKKAFIAADDDVGLQLLESGKEMTAILAKCCASIFKETNYLLVLDDFEQNQVGVDKGEPGALLPEAAELLTVLLEYLPFSGKMSQMIITGRFIFTLTHQGHDLVEEKLERIGLTQMIETEQRKKVRELPHIFAYPDTEAIEMLTLAGRGNPRLMEWIDTLVGEIGKTGVPELLAAVKDKQEEFIKTHVVRELLACGGTDMAGYFSRLSVYRRPVLLAGMREMGEQSGVTQWEELLRRGIALGLVEEDQARKGYEVTPLLKEELTTAIEDKEPVHRAAYTYYTTLCESLEEIDPVLWEEWIYHALVCGEENVATRQGGRLVTHLAKHLAFQESRRIGEWVLEEKKQELVTTDDASLLNELGNTLNNLGDHRKAILYYEQTLDIDEKTFDPEHPNVATDLNNLGTAWKALEKLQKAISYFEKALKIWRKVFGDQHQNVASALNNLGEAWRELGKPKKAIPYSEQALAIDEKIFGPKNPKVAIRLNNLGGIWKALDEPQKAISYYEQALTIDEKTYGPEHPSVARDLNNLGAAYFDLNKKKKAKELFNRAYTIWKKFFGEEHPSTKTTKEWLNHC